MWVHNLNTGFVLNNMHDPFSLPNLASTIPEFFMLICMLWFELSPLQAYWLAQRENLYSGSHSLANDKVFRHFRVHYFFDPIQGSSIKQYYGWCPKRLHLLKLHFIGWITCNCQKKPKNKTLCRWQLGFITLRNVHMSYNVREDSTRSLTASFYIYQY